MRALAMANIRRTSFRRILYVKNIDVMRSSPQGISSTDGGRITADVILKEMPFPVRSMPLRAPDSWHILHLPTSH
jgi:hypothetical protein